MQLTVKDGNGQAQTVIAQANDLATDLSGVLAGYTSVPVAPQNAARAGYFFQNQGANPMWVNELGLPATQTPVANNGSILVPPGGSFPPPGFPVSTAQISVIGTPGDTFAFRTW
jgi:hypothetical protein